MLVETRRHFIENLGLAAGALLLGTTAAEACGDKTTKQNGGVRQQQKWRDFARTHPADVIIRIDPKFAALISIKPAEIQAKLKEYGHKPRVVDSQAELDSALKAGHYDIVLTDYENARILQNQIGSSSTFKPRVLPMAYKLSKADAKAAEKSFNPIIKDAKDPGAYFGAIYEITSLKAV